MRATGFISISVGLALFLVIAAREGGLQLLTGGQWLRSFQSGETIEGPAWVSDGDTLRVNGTRIRIAGIDAPESDQTCSTPSGKIWRCGEVATAALGKFLAAKTVSCFGSSPDRHGRIIGTCETDGQDIGGWMVQSGWAMAYWHYSLRYIFVQQRAKRERAGIWVGSVQPPWEWRQTH
jgi:endonuclease YncB( thermonuclease family)